MRKNLAQRAEVNQKNISTIRAYIALDLARISLFDFVIFRAKDLLYRFIFVS
jgi:hypothetical protein